MKSALQLVLIGSLIGLAGCVEPPQPRTVTEFMENSNLLEAALVRCTQNRSETRYDVECINAREAVRFSEARSEKQRRAALEEESKRKRDALRRTQWAAAEARRRAVEAVRRREEAEYLAQFGQLPPAESEVEDSEEMQGNVPMAVIPAAQVPEPTPGGSTTTLPSEGSNAPLMAVEPEPEPEQASDLQSIRDELRRRNDDGTEQ